MKINQVEELTSSDAEEKRDIKEGVPSDDDLWGGVIERSCNMLLLIMIILTEMREATAHILFFSIPEKTEGQLSICIL